MGSIWPLAVSSSKTLLPKKQALLAKAEDCLRLASEPSTVAVTAALLRLLAADYFELAERISQQQI
jgi:hypothetical protein